MMKLGETLYCSHMTLNTSCSNAKVLYLDQNPSFDSDATPDYKYRFYLII